MEGGAGPLDPPKSVRLYTHVRLICYKWGATPRKEGLRKKTKAIDSTSAEPCKSTTKPEQHLVRTPAPWDQNFGPNLNWPIGVRPSLHDQLQTRSSMQLAASGAFAQSQKTSPALFTMSIPPIRLSSSLSFYLGVVRGPQIGPGWYPCTYGGLNNQVIMTHYLLII